MKHGYMIALAALFFLIAVPFAIAQTFTANTDSIVYYVNQTPITFYWPTKITNPIVQNGTTFYVQTANGLIWPTKVIADGTTYEITNKVPAFIYQYEGAKVRGYYIGGHSVYFTAENGDKEVIASNGLLTIIDGTKTPVKPGYCECLKYLTTFSTVETYTTRPVGIEPYVITGPQGKTYAGDINELEIAPFIVFEFRGENKTLDYVVDGNTIVGFGYDRESIVYEYPYIGFTKTIEVKRAYGLLNPVKVTLKYFLAEGDPVKNPEITLNYGGNTKTINLSLDGYRVVGWKTVQQKENNVEILVFVKPTEGYTVFEKYYAYLLPVNYYYLGLKPATPSTPAPTFGHVVNVYTTDDLSSVGLGTLSLAAVVGAIFAYLFLRR